MAERDRETGDEEPDPDDVEITMIHRAKNVVARTIILAHMLITDPQRAGFHVGVPGGITESYRDMVITVADEVGSELLAKSKCWLGGEIYSKDKCVYYFCSPQFGPEWHSHSIAAVVVVPGLDRLPNLPA